MSETRSDHDAEAELEHAADELDHHIHRLDEHLSEAEQRARERRAEVDPGAAGAVEELDDDGPDDAD